MMGGVPEVAFLLNSLAIGGSEAKSIQLVNHLRRKGWPVHLLYLNAPITLRDRLDPMVPTACLNRVGRISIPALFRLRDYLKSHNVRTLVSVNLYPNFYGSVARLYDKGRSLRGIVTVNTSDHMTAFERAKMIVYAPLLRSADQIVFGSRGQMENWIARYRLRASRCSVIYNGANTSIFTAAPGTCRNSKLASRLRLDPSDFVIGTIGRLEPEKNQRQLIMAVRALSSELPQIKAVIVGEGRERDSLERLIAEQRLQDRVSLIGAINDVRPVLELLDVFILPSVAVETFSNAALEAMAMSRPVILSDVGGAKEMVEHGESGYVYPKGDIRSLIVHLRTLATDEDKRAVFGSNARARVLEKFSIEKMVSQYESLLGFAS